MTIIVWILETNIEFFRFWRQYWNDFWISAIKDKGSICLTKGLRKPSLLGSKIGVCSGLTEQKVIASPILTGLANTLETLGYSSRFGPQITGMSSITHTFDLVATRGADTIVIQMLPTLDYEAASGKLLELQAKAWDCSPDLAIAIIPLGSDIESLRKLASFYNFVLIEGDTVVQVSRRLKEVLTALEDQAFQGLPNVKA